MSNYVNGRGYPILRFYDGTTLIQTIELPLTNTKGLIETIEEKAIYQETIRYTTYKEVLGYKINFKLFYDEYTAKDTSLKIKDILLLEKQGYKVVLQPRNDIGRNYEVVGLNENVSIGILKHGGGNRGIELNYVTKYLIDTLDWVDPDNIQIIDEYKITT